MFLPQLSQQISYFIDFSLSFNLVLGLLSNCFKDHVVGNEVLFHQTLKLCIGKKRVINISN